jgi:septum formation topological specificity factor MinE
MDNYHNWREHIQRLEEDILKVVVRYCEQKDETERDNVRFEREQEWVEMPMASKEIVIIIIIII